VEQTFWKQFCCVGIASIIIKERIYCVLITLAAIFWLMIVVVKGVFDVLSRVHFRGWPSIIKRDVDVLMLLHFKTSVVVMCIFFLCMWEVWLVNRGCCDFLYREESFVIVAAMYESFLLPYSWKLKHTKNFEPPFSYLYKLCIHGYYKYRVYKIKIRSN
jgi:hypothetical protein